MPRTVSVDARLILSPSLSGCQAADADANFRPHAHFPFLFRRQGKSLARTMRLPDANERWVGNYRLTFRPTGRFC
ncbi:hypothetical protein BDV32DRAFT_129689 [Aspergillus pseudonomiae]|nr:hypothetical protein BDV32DRAFT_129689 [Aspergillus pseudonomiae]